MKLNEFAKSVLNIIPVISNLQLTGEYEYRIQNDDPQMDPLNTVNCIFRCI